MIKQVFLIIGAMLVSLLLFISIFSDTSRSMVWSVMEPTFIRLWEEITLNDGRLVSELNNEMFYNLKEIQ
jgi:hypothetical protein